MRDIYFGDDGIKLHGVVNHCDTAGAPAVIICHPHPQYGGNMNNNVVLGVEKEAVEAGYTSMRFNFRGVGRSEGGFEGGVGEKDDVRWAVDALAADSAVGKIIVVGYSFGAVAALPAAADDERVSAVCGIAPPTVMADFSFLKEITKPLLIITGSADEFCEHKIIKSCVPGGGKIEILPGVDHFFIGQELRAGKLVSDFIKKNIK